jgi:diguanylate cyclase (GGDEF)-like protein
MPMLPRMPSHRDLHARALRLRESVIARLLLTLVLALSAVGTFQYFIVGDRVESDLIREHAAVHAADARSLEQRAAAAQNNRYEQPLSEVTEVLAAIAQRPDTLDVALLDLDGTVLASPRPGQVGVVKNDPLLRRVAHTHKPLSGVPTADGKRNAYITSMRLLDREVLFTEYRSSSSLKSGVASFRDSLALFVLLSLLIALPLFYVLGGRSVGVLYRAALQRARRDGLTDLDNHRAFQDELARAVGEATRYDSPFTLALLDIDDFKFENDRHGHQHGDRLLCELAELLREQRAGDRAFRLGGDEFALLLGHTDEPDADVPLERIRGLVERRLSGVTASIGFAAVQAGDREPTSLWGRADAALLEAKRRGGNAIVASAEVADSVPVVTIEKVRAVRSLIDAGAVDVAFQPIWDLPGTRVLGYEALARPRSAELTGPGEAFEIADSIGRGHELDAVCRRATLRAAGELPKGALLFLNVSPQTLEHDGLAGDSLVLAVRGAGYEPEQVVLEITERTDARKELLIPEAARLRRLGFKLALDDVGAGNAGLEMLSALPVDFIKIDRAVVANAVDDRGARAVMLGIMAFARESGAFVIAEGIETEAMLELARDPDPDREARPVGAHGAQGFLLGRPAPVPAEAPSYDATLRTLTELTAERERRRIATALQRGDELYRVLIRTVPDLIVALFDRDLRCQVVDGGMGTLELWRELLEGKTVREALGRDGDGEHLDALLRPVLAGEPADFEWVGRRSGAHLSVQAVPVRDERAGVIGVMAVCRDVTPVHEVDTALRSSRRRPTGAPTRAS